MLLYFFFIQKVSTAFKRNYDKAFDTSPPTNESDNSIELAKNSDHDDSESITLDFTSNTMDLNICLVNDSGENSNTTVKSPKIQKLQEVSGDENNEKQLGEKNSEIFELFFQTENYSIDMTNIFDYTDESYKEDYLEKILISFHGARQGVGKTRPSSFYLWFRDQKLKSDMRRIVYANKKQQERSDVKEFIFDPKTTANNFTFKFKEKSITLKVPNKLCVNLIIRTKIIERITSFRLYTLLVFLNNPSPLPKAKRKVSKITKNFFASLGLFVDNYILDFSMKKFYLFDNDSENQNTYIDTRNLDYASKLDCIIEELITSFKNLVRDSFSNYFHFFKRSNKIFRTQILGLENFPNCANKELFLKKLFELEFSKMTYEILKLMFPELEELIEIISTKKLDSHKFLCLYFMLEILVFKFEIYRTEMKKETYASSRKRLLYLKKSSLIRNFIFSSRIFIYLNCCFLLDFDENSMFIANLLLKTFLNFVDIKNQLYLKLFVFDDFFLEKFKLSENQFSDASFETNKMFYGENETDFFDVPLLESLPNRWIKHRSENINEFLLEIILENKPDFFDEEKSKYLVYAKEGEILFNLDKYMSDQQLSFTQEFNQQII